MRFLLHKESSTSKSAWYGLTRSKCDCVTCLWSTCRTFFRTCCSLCTVVEHIFVFLKFMKIFRSDVASSVRPVRIPFCSFSLILSQVIAVAATYLPQFGRFGACSATFACLWSRSKQYRRRSFLSSAGSEHVLQLLPPFEPGRSSSGGVASSVRLARTACSTFLRTSDQVGAVAAT